MADGDEYGHLAESLNRLQYECGRFERNMEESKIAMAHASNFSQILGTMCALRRPLRTPGPLQRA